MAKYVYDWKTVPDDPAENAIWRARTLDACSSKHPNAAKLRRNIMEMCRKDFW